MDVDPTGISVKERAQYPGRSGQAPEMAGGNSEASPEVSRGHSSQETDEGLNIDKSIDARLSRRRTNAAKAVEETASRGERSGGIPPGYPKEAHAKSAGMENINRASELAIELAQ